MAKKSLVILLVIAVVIAGAVGGTMIFLGQQNSANMQEAEPEQTKTPDINLSDAGDMAVTYIKLEQNDKVIELSFADNVWSMAGSIAPIDQKTASGIAEGLADITALHTVDTGELSLADFGLEESGLKVLYTTKNGTFTNYYGKYTQDKNAVFFRKNSDSSVYIIQTQDYENIQNGYNALEENMINIPSSDETGFIAVKTSQGEEIVFLAQPDLSLPWIMSSPYNLAITEQTSSLINNSFGNSVLQEYAGEKALPSFKLGGGTWIEYKDNSGNVIAHLNIGAPVKSKTGKDSYYCSVEGKQGVFLTSGNIADIVDSDAFSLIDNRLLSSGEFSMFEKLTITKDETSAVLTQMGEEYTLNENSITKEQAQALYTKLEEISFTDAVTQKVGAVAYCTLSLKQQGKEDININVYLYLKDFYAIDYGSGPQVYVQAKQFDEMLDEFF